MFDSPDVFIAHSLLLRFDANPRPSSDEAYLSMRADVFRVKHMRKIRSNLTADSWKGNVFLLIRFMICSKLKLGSEWKMLKNACCVRFTGVSEFLMSPPLDVYMCMKPFLEVTCHSVDIYPLELPVKEAQEFSLGSRLSEMLLRASWSSNRCFFSVSRV